MEKFESIFVNKKFEHRLMQSESKYYFN